MSSKNNGNTSSDKFRNQSSSSQKNQIKSKKFEEPFRGTSCPGNKSHRFVNSLITIKEEKN